jgi:hypothetical protein
MAQKLKRKRKKKGKKGEGKDRKNQYTILTDAGCLVRKLNKRPSVIP